MVDDRAQRIAELVKALKELDCDVSIVTSNTEAVDQTKGLVGEVKADESRRRIEDNEGLILEIADSGKGFAISRDFSKLDKNKFKRLTRS